MQEYQRENGHMVLCHIWMRFRRGKQRAESASVVHILESEAWDIGNPNRADEGGVTNNHIESQIVTGWFQRFVLDQRDRGWFNAVGVSFTILRNSWEVLALIVMFLSQMY